MVKKIKGIKEQVLSKAKQLHDASERKRAIKDAEKAREARN